MSAPYNPYQAPAAKVDDVSDAADPQAEAVRRHHIQHEASIKAVGALYYLSALGLGFSGLMSLSILFDSTGPVAQKNASVVVLLGIIFVAMAVLMFFVAGGLRKLRPWARVPTVLLSVVGLLGFPVGTLINGYIIWLILSQKGRFIFTPEYAVIIAFTPQVKYKTSVIVWIFLGLLLLVLFAGVLAMFWK